MSPCFPPKSLGVSYGRLRGFCGCCSSRSLYAGCKIHQLAKRPSFKFMTTQAVDIARPSAHLTLAWALAPKTRWPPASIISCIITKSVITKSGSVSFIWAQFVFVWFLCRKRTFLTASLIGGGGKGNGLVIGGRDYISSLSLFHTWTAAIDSMIDRLRTPNVAHPPSFSRPLAPLHSRLPSPARLNSASLGGSAHCRNMPK